MGELNMPDDVVAQRPDYNDNDMNKNPSRGLLLIDLDDTLLDNTYADVASFQHALKIYGIKYTNKDNIIKWRKTGMRAGTIFYKICNGDTDTVKKCMAWRHKYLRGGGSIRHTTLKEDAAFALRRLKAKYDIVVVSARSHKDIIIKILHMHNIDRYVSDVLCADDYSKKEIKFEDYAALKGELYGLALERFSPKREDCVAVGNLKSDIMGAVNIGISAYAVRGTYGFDRGIKKIAKTFKNLSEIAEALLSQNGVRYPRRSP